MALRIYLDGQNVTTLVDDPEGLDDQSEAREEGADFRFLLHSARSGAVLGFVPRYGDEVMFYDHNANPSLHDYRFAGKVVSSSRTDTPEGILYTVTCTDFADELNTPASRIAFTQAAHPHPASRVTELIDEVDLPGSWDAVTQVLPDASITYPTGSVDVYEDISARELLDVLASYPGQTTDNLYPRPPRTWYVKGEWQDPANPGVGGIKRVLYFYPTDSAPTVAAPLAGIPLTDDPSGFADWVVDTFARENDATSLGVALSGQLGAALWGTWAIHNQRARMEAHGGAASINSWIWDSLKSDGDVTMEIPTISNGQGMVFRVESLPAQTYKWNGFLFVRESSTQAKLYKYAGGLLSDLGAYSVTWNGTLDALKVVLADDEISLYVNGTFLDTLNSSFNQTKTVHGLGMRLVTTGVVWDNFRVRAGGAAVYWTGSEYEEEGSEYVSAARIKGPGADPTPVAWANEVRVQAGAGLLRKGEIPAAWQASTLYAEGDRRIPTAANYKGRHYRVSVAGTSGATEPDWDTALNEGQTVSGDGGVTWTADTWDAGATSSDDMVITEDGGEVTLTIDETTVARDGFERPDNSVRLEQTETGQNWEVLVTGGGTARYGVIGGQAYVYDATGKAVAVVDVGFGTGVIEVTMPAALVAGAWRFAFNVVDADNYLFIQANATSYGLYKRVAGVETLLASHSVTPAAGDVIKVSREHDVVKVYRNGTGPHITQTEATFTGARKAGLGVDPGVGGYTSIRWDGFRAWTSYGDAAFGLGVGNTSAHADDIDFSLRRSANRTVQVYENGVAKGSLFSYAVGDALRVECRKTVHPDAPRERWTVRYWKLAAGSSEWTLLYTSLTNPTPTAANPLRVDASIYHDGGALTGVTLRRFTSGFYYDDRVDANGQTSIEKYGLRWMNGRLEDPSLDTEEKRKLASYSLFGKWGAPFTRHHLMTLNSTIREGMRVFKQSTRFGIEETRIVSSRSVKYFRGDAPPEYTLVVGDAELEEGDEPGYLLRGLDTETRPATPTNFRLLGTLNYTPEEARAQLAWDAGPAQFLEVELEAVGYGPEGGGTGAAGDGVDTAPEPIRFPFMPPFAWLVGLRYNATYRARARARGYNGYTSEGWTPYIEIRTGSYRFPAPSGLALARTWAGAEEGVVEGELTWLAVQGIPLSHWEIEWHRTTERWQSTTAPAEATSAPVRGMFAGSNYYFRVRGVPLGGRPGDWAQIGPIAVSARPRPPHEPPSFEGGLYDSLLAGWTATNTVGTVDWAIEEAVAAHIGKRYVTADMSSGSEAGYLFSPPIACTAGVPFVPRVAVIRLSGAATVLAAVEAVFYNSSDVTTGTQTLRASATLTTSWVESSVKVTPPAGSVYYRIKYTASAPGLGPTASGKVGFSSPGVQPEVGTVHIADGAISDAKLGTLIDPTNFEFNIETSPLLLYNSAGAFIGRVYYDPTGSGKVVFAAQSAVGTPDVSLEGGGGVGFDITTAGYHLEEAGLSLLRTAISANTTLNQDHMVVLASNTITLTLPDAAAAAHDRRVYIIKNVGTGTVTIDGDGADTIDGAPTYPLLDQYDAVMIQADGTNWRVLGAKLKRNRTYDGTRWLGEEEAIPFHMYDHQYPISTSREYANVVLGKDYVITHFSLRYFVSGTNNGSNFWTVHLARYNSGAGRTNMASISTASGSAGSWQFPATVTAFLGNPVDDTDLGLWIQPETTGSPGTIQMLFSVRGCPVLA